VVAETLLIGLLLVSMRERRQALTALATERATLERRVAERTRDLAAANAQLARLSMTDSLTRLANRRRFDEALAEEFQRLRRSGAPLTLIMIDLDHFKPYNDRYGHVAGDECLRRVGTLIGEVVRRPPDLAARYGGEELAVILPETNAGGARQVAERIRAGIASLAIPHAASAVADHVTASLGGVTLVPTEVESPIDLIHLADEQLYRAKSEGRNRIAMASLGGSDRSW
jgi:diguanylate cyclase (GGDEF)-like protein